MKINPFQGMTDHIILTNKLLGTMNTNMANFISEMRNSIKVTPVKEFNQELEKSSKSTILAENEVVKALKDLSEQAKSIENFNLSASVSDYLDELKARMVDIDVKSEETGNQLKRTFGKEEFEKYKQALAEATDENYFNNLIEKLKEVEKEYRNCGETAKANKIKEFIQQTNKETVNLENSMDELRKYIEKTFGTDTLRQFDRELKNVDKTTQNVGKKSNFGSNLKTALGIGTVALGIRKAVGFFKEATTESVDYVETQNLFNVSMGKTVDQYGNLDREASKYYTKAMAFQEKLSDKLKINIEESMEYQALFNAMSKSMGIGDEPSYKISENFTKLGYDLSSLYNIDPENAMQKLRAGLSGQTKPLRDLGLDITQQSLEPLLDELGIERSTKQLSQAEKMIARYIVVLRQASLAHGDFAKTMDSPANQLRIFNAQLTAFKRNMGNLWQGLLGNILPYVNAIMMVINELLKMVAKLFGFEVSDQNVNISAGIGADDLADDLGTATGKAKELKKQLMGFDEINNITLPENPSTGSGASVGGIDQKLLDAMKEYDNMMDKVKSKATEIKNQIMKWLGFTGDTEKDLAKMKEWLDKIKKVAGLILALYIGAKLLKLIGYVRTLGGVLTGTVAPTTSFQNGLALVGTGLKNTGTWLKIGADQFKTYIKHGEGVGKALAKTGQGMLDLIPKTVRVAGGIAGLVASCGLAYSSMQDLSNGTIGTGEAIAKLTGSIAGATASGAMLGSVFGPLGTVIGALAGLVTSLFMAYEGYNSEAFQSIQRSAELKKEIEASNNAYQQKIKSIDDSVNSQMAEIKYTEKLKEQLGKIVDENGNVKKGYEERADYILGELNNALGTEYKRNGKVIDNYKEMTKEIDKLIEEKKKKIKLEALEEKYKETLKKQIEDTDNLTKAQDEYNTVLKEYEDWKKNYNPLTSSAYDVAKHNKMLKDAEDNLNNIKKTAEDTTNEIARYEAQLTLDTINTSEKISADLTGLGQTVLENMSSIAKSSSTQFLQELEKYSPAVQTSLMAQTNTLDQKSPQVIAKWKQLAEKSSNEFMIGIAKAEPAVQAQILSSITTTDNLTPDMKKAWGNLAKQSETDFTNAIREVPVEARGVILNSITVAEGLTEKTKTAWAELAQASEKEYNIALSMLPEDTRKKVQSTINEINKKKPQAKSSGGGIANETLAGAKQKVNDKNSGASKIGQWFVGGFLGSLTDKGALNGVFGAGWNLVKAALNGGKEAQNSHSPSKETLKLGNYFTEGYILGLKEKQAELRKTAENLVGIALNEMEELGSNSITINPNDFKIDTNQFIDYGQISGAIATQSNVEVSSSLPQQVKEAVIEGMRNSKIKVEVEGKADKNAIFQVVQAGADEYYMQTGEPAFNF